MTFLERKENEDMKQEDYELIKRMRLNGKLSNRHSRQAKEIEEEHEKQLQEQQEIEERTNKQREELKQMAKGSNKKLKKWKKDGLI